MAVKEISGFLKYKDSSGDINLLFPITTKDNVDGLDEIENELANAVKVTKQTLTDAQKEQARVNIGAQPIGDYALQSSYEESIIGLSVEGRTVTYIKGDGSVHTFETQDTDTTYSIGTDTTTGLTKLYATTGSAEDGTMTQKAIKTELDKKVSVNVDDTQNMLIFTL